MSTAPAWGEAPARAGALGTPGAEVGSKAGSAGGAGAGADVWRVQAEDGAWRALLDGLAAGAGASAGEGAAGEGGGLGGSGPARACYRALALFKLRRFVEAEQAASAGADRRQPFALQWLHAELPAHTGSPAEALERLYALLGHCRERGSPSGEPLPQPPQPGVSGAQAAGEGPAEGVSAWERRHDFVLYSLVRHHLGRGEFFAALQLLSWLLDHRGRPTAALAMVVRVLLQVGDVRAANGALLELEARVGGLDDAADPARAEGLRTRALVQFANLQYVEAGATLDAVLKERPWDVVACNNRAVSQMYSKDIVGAINRLEGSLRQFPHQMLREGFVGNLASLYELSSADAPGAKRQLAQWAMEFAPDDFDVAKF